MKNKNKFYKGFVGIKSNTTHIRLKKNCLVSTFCVQIQVHVIAVKYDLFLCMTWFDFWFEKDL